MLYLSDFILDDSDLDPVLPWKLFLKGNRSFPHHVLRVWYGNLDVSMDTESLSYMYRTLSHLQSARQSHIDPQQVTEMCCEAFNDCYWIHLTELAADHNECLKIQMVQRLQWLDTLSVTWFHIRDPLVPSDENIFNSV